MVFRAARQQKQVHDRFLQLPDEPSDAELDELTHWVRANPHRLGFLVGEVKTSFDAAPSLSALRRAERVLAGTDNDRVIAQLRDTLRAARPDLLYPLEQPFQERLSGNKLGRLRKLLDAALTSGDATGADLDMLLTAANQLVNTDAFRDALAYVGEHRDEAAATPDSHFPRAQELVDILDGLAPGWESRLDDWIRSAQDATFAFTTAVTLKVPPAISNLAGRIDSADLTDRQLSRAAVQLWRAGDNAPALDLARAVRSDSTSAAATAQLIIGEYESFDLMESGWAPPARSSEPAYVPAPRSVLHVLQNSLPHRRTGSANRTQGLLAGIVSAGYRVTAVTPPGFPHADVRDPSQQVEARHEIQGVTYQHLLNDGTVLPRFPVDRYVDTYSAGIVEQARAESAGLIHAASNSYNALSGIVAARQLGIPSIYEVRGLYEEGRRSRDEAYASTPQYTFAVHLETLAANEADRVIAITEGLKNTLIGRGVPADKIDVVTNGVDSTRFQPLARDVELARHYGLEDNIVIGYIGSFHWYEGHGLLFETFARLHAKHPDVRLLMVGDGPEFENLSNLRSTLGLEDVILMPGSVPFEQVEAHYSLVDIAPITRLSSPVTETVSPLKPFEAMAMAKTVVSSDVAVMAEIIDDDRTGLLFTKNDSASLETVLERLVLDADLRDRLGRQAREWVVEERDWKILGERVAEIYRRLGV
ncbi:MAG: hypothetical protein QOJ72_1753 [Nocardioidaceae bacterium]|nr:hypothetical protein [Nocardioidaceae bacterium]